jgi:hypothetical protein
MMLSLAAALFAAPAYAQDAGSYEHHLEQARLFIKREWYSDALKELEAAREADPGGFEAWLLTAQVRYSLKDVEGAWKAAGEAADKAGSDEERASAEQLEGYLKSTFGVLRIKGPYEAAASILQVEASDPVLDPELKKWIDDVALELRSRTLLPVDVGLPAGSYVINGQPAEVVAGSDRSVQLANDDLGARGMAKLLVPRVEVGTGVGVLFSSRVPDIQPGLVTELGFTQPFGRLIFGAVVDYSLRTYQVSGGSDFNPRAVGGGLRFGTELMVGGPLALRPSVGYRFSLVPGVPLDCASPDLDGAWSCTPPGDEGVADATLYAVGRAHTPFGEIAIDWRRAGRTTATGFGVRAAVEQAIGTLPETGEARIDGSEDTLQFTVTERGWTATGVRLLAELSLTL